MQNGLLRGWAQRLIRKVFTEGTCKGCFLRLVLDVSFQLQLLLRWWTYKKNAGLRKLCICFTFQTQKHHPSLILSSCKQSSFYKKVLKFESLHNSNIICDLFCSSKIDVHFWQYLQAQHTLYSSRSTSLLALLSATMVARSRVRESSCLGAVTSVFRSVHMGSDHQDSLECCMWTGSVFPCALS